ncbi:hypothetical protein HK101_004040 [Irineochytrium annulatum]|nr:hypothetical protein HK101_004040 [Irineochytrium annulatum]
MPHPAAHARPVATLQLHPLATLHRREAFGDEDRAHKAAKAAHAGDGGGYVHTTDVVSLTHSGMGDRTVVRMLVPAASFTSTLRRKPAARVDQFDVEKALKFSAKFFTKPEAGIFPLPMTGASPATPNLTPTDDRSRSPSPHPSQKQYWAEANVHALPLHRSFALDGTPFRLPANPTWTLDATRPSHSAPRFVCSMPSGAVLAETGGLDEELVDEGGRQAGAPGMLCVRVDARCADGGLLNTLVLMGWVLAQAFKEDPEHWLGKVGEGSGRNSADAKGECAIM